MTTWELKPPALPDTSDFKDALQKGLGRALAWSKQGMWTDKRILLDACMHDLRHDRQLEDARGPWLWSIMEAVGAIEEFRDAILQGLQDINDGLAAVQLCQFSVLYARRGDERFRSRLREIVIQKPIEDCSWLGAEELIDLDAEEGFQLILRARSESLLNSQWVTVHRQANRHGQDKPCR